MTNPNPDTSGLKPAWKPGDPSPNPNGRKRGTENSSTRLMRILALVQKKKNPISGEEEEFTVLEQMDMAMILKALKGNERAYQEVIDRLEGKPKQEIDQKTTAINPRQMKLPDGTIIDL